MYIQHTAVQATQPQSVLSLNITVCPKNQGITFEVICNKETTKSKKYSHLLLLLLRLIMGIIPR